MPIKSRFKRPKAIPRISSRKIESVSGGFGGGIKTYPPNDELRTSDLLVAQDVRMTKVGKYRTRLGNTVKIDAIGRQTALEQWTAENLEEYVLSGSGALEVVIAPQDDFRLWAVQFMARKDAESLGVVSVKLFSTKDDGSIAELVAHSNINYSDLTTTQEQVEVKFVNAPDLTSGKNYILQFSLQPDAVGNFYLQTSADFTQGGVLYRVISATPGVIKNIFVHNTVDGTPTTVFVFNNSLYRAAEDGTTTLIRELLENTSKVRFSQELGQIRYADGLEKPHLIDADWSDSEIDAALANVSHILNRQQSLYYVNPDEGTQMFWTEEFSEENGYDTFNTDYFQHFMAPLSGDNITAAIDLGGVMYVFTARWKYQMFNQTVDVWSATTSLAQKGTWSQESVVCDTNFAYFASNDGLYVFDGSSEKDLLGESVNDLYSSIVHKEKIVLDLHDNRLFMYYPSGANEDNDSCLVYNLVAGAVESIDTSEYVSATCARKNPKGIFLTGSNRVGVIYMAEDSNANHSNVGAALKSEIAPSFYGFGAPARSKRLTKWRPELSEEDREYKVDCGFAKDFSTSVNYAFSISVYSGERVAYQDYGWGDATPGTILSNRPYIFGEFRRAQLRYKHHAAFEPFTIEGHTISVQAQRLR